MINLEWPDKKEEYWRSSKVWPLLETVSWQQPSDTSYLSINHKNDKLLMDHPVSDFDLSQCADPFLHAIGHVSSRQSYLLGSGHWDAIYSPEHSQISWHEFTVQSGQVVNFSHTVKSQSANWQINVMVFHVEEGASLTVESMINSPDFKGVNIWIINQSKHSNFSYHRQHLDFTYQRDHVWVNQNGERANTSLKGVYASHGKQISEQLWTVTHHASHGTSSQNLRGVLADKAHAVAISQVNVIPGIAKIDSQQKLDHILLSSKATVHTRPQLEILSDDVVCQHGITVGALDEEALFYLQSRAIDPGLATNLLLKGFFEQIWQQELSPLLCEKLDLVLSEQKVEEINE